MPAVVWEETGRSFRLGEGRPEDRLRYFVTDAFSELEALNAIALVVPSTWNGLWFLNTEAEEVGLGYWRGTANYGIPTGGTVVPSQVGGSPPPPPPPPAATDALGPEWSFDTSGGTRHVTTSFETREKQTGAGFTGTTPDNKRAIGAGKTGVEGCDVVAAKFEISVTRKMEALSLQYIWTLVELTGKVNDDTFLTVFEAGTLLFLGASITYRDNDGWSIVYRFSAAPNRTGNPEASSPLDRISPRGHDYVWVMFEDEASDTYKIPVPAAAFVERVYEEGDFDLLGM